MLPFKANNGYDMTLTGEGPTRGRDIPLRLALLTKLHTRCKLWLDQAQRRQATQYNKKHQAVPTLKQGDQVWLDSTDLVTNRPSPKLEALCFGPFTIEKVMGPLTYKLELPDTWQVNCVFHQNKLHPVTPDEIPERTHVTQTPNHVQAREGDTIITNPNETLENTPNQRRRNPRRT